MTTTTTMIHICPLAPAHPKHRRFHTTAHVSQTWLVDQDGHFQGEVSTDDTTHAPDNGNEWTCAECGAIAQCVPADQAPAVINDPDERGYQAALMRKAIMTWLQAQQLEQDAAHMKRRAHQMAYDSLGYRDIDSNLVVEVDGISYLIYVDEEGHMSDPQPITRIEPDRGGVEAVPAPPPPYTFDLIRIADQQVVTPKRVWCTTADQAVTEGADAGLGLGGDDWSDSYRLNILRRPVGAEWHA